MNTHRSRLLRLVLTLAVLLVAAAMAVSCAGNGQKQYVIGVSQCSEDTWREKLNEELRIAAMYYNNVDLRISSAFDDVQLQTQQIDKFVKQGVDLLIVAPGQVTISPASRTTPAMSLPRMCGRGILMPGSPPRAHTSR